MTETQIAGWFGAGLPKESLCIELTPAALSAVEKLVEDSRDREPKLQDVTRESFSAPGLDEFLAEALRRIKAPPGVLIIRGFPVDRYTVSQIEWIYYGLGTHFGIPCSQSVAGDLIGYVTDRGNSRGYTSTRKLDIHVDSAEIVGLLCVRKAKEGGETVLASSLKIYEIIAEKDPDALHILKRGFRLHRRGEEQAGQEPITPYNVPVFSTERGVLSCRYVPERIELAVKAGAYSLTDAERAALTLFESIALSPKVRLDLQLEPGEALFINNFELLHSRTAFVDWEEQGRKRLLLRLWVEGERPVRKEIFTYQNPSGHQGIDPVPGRRPGDMAYLPPSSEFRSAGGISSD